MHRLGAVVAALVLAAGLLLSADKPVSDDYINDTVRIKLAGDADVKGGGGTLNVEVHQGVVTLSGSVETSRQKDKAAKLARKVRGVKQVINNLEIKKKG